MNTAHNTKHMVNIVEQLNELNLMINPDDKMWASGVLHGMCMAYFSMGVINEADLDEINKAAHGAGSTRSRASQCINNL